MTLRDTYNTIAEDWHKDHSDDTWWKNIVERFTMMLKPGSTVLDVGCGGGIMAKYLSEKGLTVTGIDFSENQIAIAKREVPAAKFMVADLYDLDSIEGQFDAVFAQAVLLHIPKKDITGIMEKLVAKLRDGGYMYIAVKKRESNEQEEVVLQENDYGKSFERFFSYFLAPEVQDFVQRAGLQTVFSETTQSGNTKWIQIIAKKVQW